jgi:large subunit ribosomal protein L24
MESKSRQPGKQRKALYTSPLHKKQKMISAHLSEKLRSKEKRRSMGVRKGDTVIVMRGDYKGHKGKVVKVSLKRRKIFVEGVTVQKADGSDRFYPVDPSNVKIVKLAKRTKK